MSLATPVVLILFNRPDRTIRVLNSIRAAKPRQLFVIGDGPRANKPGEKELCERTRAVIDRVDWTCDVKTLYAATNMGCAARIPSGVSWVFEQVERAIILEDDCVAHPSFFPYCDEMLERYCDDTRVMHITGCNFLGERVHSDSSYFFTRYGHMCSWATWRRAWKHFDPAMTSWPRAKASNLLRSMFDDPAEIKFWMDIFDYMHDHQPRDIWDYAWYFACWAGSGLNIYPRRNLITNIGDGPDATHTQTGWPFMNLPAHDLGPIVHPQFIAASKEADDATFNVLFGGESLRRQATLLGRLRLSIGLRTRLRNLRARLHATEQAAV